MFGLIKIFFQDLRIKMATDELYCYVTSINDIERAKILIMAQEMRLQLQNDGAPTELLATPSVFSRTILMNAYEAIEDQRINFLNHKANLKNRFGSAIPEFPLDKTILIWMVTLGYGMIPSLKPKARKIWEMLINSKSSLDKASSILLEGEKVTKSMFSEHKGMLIFQLPEGVGKHCSFVPSDLNN
jgi:hypothetical protein